MGAERMEWVFHEFHALFFVCYSSFFVCYIIWIVNQQARGILRGKFK